MITLALAMADCLLSGCSSRYCVQVPNTELFTPDDPWKQDQLQYTVFPPQNYTLYNGTYRIGILLKGTSN